ncbi:RdgB/HAM1 family non-canonical purine NTP pyrophosphatase [Allohahella sp. A8]|uniref:RdgB/HAM1 family non-canonical purine NTP pyrophosphatase n=1 Tax=Allohahella sp. A8 TaxID=3141461 RepID=UPI003A7F92A2
MNIIIASGNKGKLKEFATLFSGVTTKPSREFNLVAQSELGIESCEEPASTFVENAILKARHACAEARARGHEGAALADDSGLCVNALSGAPGIFSARFAGMHGRLPAEGQSVDAVNIEELLHQLQGIDGNRRHASFYCALALLRHADDPAPLVACGRWHGRILDAPVGDSGFGYDPVFFVPDLGKTAAELSPGQKNALSHRGQALRLLALQLPGL